MQGLLLINKPEDITSFKAVAMVRKAANTKKVGHTGTLDPLATGVLPILVGRATSLTPYILNADKKYIATVKCGITTDTLDTTGTVLTEATPSFTKEDLLFAIDKFSGTIIQYPPVYSAIKKDGIPLYKLARAGKEVTVEPRKITVFSIKLLEFNEDYSFKIEVHCSKGTYIRSLCRDIGEFLGCGAVMSGLIRTAAGPFDLKQCVELSDINEENIGEFLLGEELAVAHLPAVSVTKKQAFRFSNGGKLSFERLNENIVPDLYYRVKFEENFIGIGYADGQNCMLTVKCLINPIT